jgi:GGDEF domain-containing protein
MPKLLLLYLKTLLNTRKTEEQVRFPCLFRQFDRLPNRFSSRNSSTKPWHMQQRHKLILATLFLDVDNFKCINDTWAMILVTSFLQAVTSGL